MSTEFYSFRFLVYDVFPVSQQPVFSQSADDDYVRRVETCLDPCGLNWSNEAASTAADDEYLRLLVNMLITIFSIAPSSVSFFSCWFC